MTDQDVTSILHSRGKVVLIWLGAEMSTNLMNIWTHQKACKLVSKVIKLPRGGVRPSSAAVIGPRWCLWMWPSASLIIVLHELSLGA
jgi:hypothetical protein